MSQFQNVPQKFTDAAGNVNVAALAQGVQHLGGNAIEHQLGDGTFNIEGLVIAYNTLESSKGQNLPIVQPAVEVKIDPASAPKLNTDAASNPSQMDWDAMTKEIQQFGDLQPATKQNLLSAGMSEAVISQHIAGIKAVSEVNIRKMADTIGGMENYGEFVNWSNANMSIEDRQALVSAMNTPGGHMALAGAYQQYVQSGAAPKGGEPNSINTLTAGGGAQGQGLSPFMSRIERQAAFRDIRYGRDAEYTNQVQERVRVTHQLMQNEAKS